MWIQGTCGVNLSPSSARGGSRKCNNARKGLPSPSVQQPQGVMSLNSLSFDLRLGRSRVLTAAVSLSTHGFRAPSRPEISPAWHGGICKPAAMVSAVELLESSFSSESLKVVSGVYGPNLALVQAQAHGLPQGNGSFMNTRSSSHYSPAPGLMKAA